MRFVSLLLFTLLLTGLTQEARPASTAAVPDAATLKALLARHFGGLVQPLDQARPRAWRGAFSGPGGVDLLLPVAAVGAPAGLAAGVRLHRPFPQAGDAGLNGPDKAAFAIAILHGADPAFSQVKAAHLLVNIQRAGVAGLPGADTLTPLPASAHLRKLGCAADALRIDTESGAAMYLCRVRDGYRVLGDPDDLP